MNVQSSPATPLGIDFGTISQSVGVWQQNKVEITGNINRNSEIPTLVAFTSPAQAKHNIKPNNFTSEKITADLLNTLTEITKNHEGNPLKYTVISVPAYFDSSQRKSVKDALNIAGLNLFRIISKPFAAVFAFQYFHNKNFNDQKHVLTFDIGSETTEVSVMCVSRSSYEIKIVAFDQGLGSTNFVNRLVKHLNNEYKRRFKADLKSDSVYKLQNAAQQAKQALYSTSEVEVKVNAIADNVNFQTKLTLSKFEEICSDLIKKTIFLVNKALQDAKLPPSSIDHVVLIGGSTRIQKIRNLLEDLFISKIFDLPVEPKVTGAYGAAIFAAILSKDFSTGSEMEIGTFTLLDLLPFTISIEIVGRESLKLVKRNTKIPCKRTHTFTNNSECSPPLTVKVYEGERTEILKNKILCTFKITNISPVHYGTITIDITFCFDENGILEITAEENGLSVSRPLRVIYLSEGQQSSKVCNKMTADEMFKTGVKKKK